MTLTCLNPYCSGRWSRTSVTIERYEDGGLNPYCSGRWSRTQVCCLEKRMELVVLILIVVEDGLVL